MIKRLSVWMSAALIALVFAGCSGDPPPDETEPPPYENFQEGDFDWDDWEDWDDAEEEDDFNFPPPIELDDTTVATVNGANISALEVGFLITDAQWLLWDEYTELFPDDTDFDFSREFREGVTFERAVLEKAVELAATKAIYADYAAQHGITVSDEQLEHIHWELVTMEDEWNPRELDALLRSDAIQGVRHFEEIQISFALIHAVVSTIIDDPAKFAAFEQYLEEAEEFDFDSVELLGAMHILLDANLFDSEEDAIQFANELRERALDGGDFAEMMFVYGQDPGIAENPYGYTFVSGAMPQEFEEAVQSLEIGEIGEPLVTFHGMHGIHIIKRIEPVQENTLFPPGEGPLPLIERMSQAVQSGFETKVAAAEIIFKPELETIPVERHAVG